MSDTKLKAFDVRSITFTMRMCDGSPARTLQANQHSSVKHLLKAMHKLWVIEPTVRKASTNE
jgi:hypothetical protein